MKTRSFLAVALFAGVLTTRLPAAQITGSLTTGPNPSVNLTSLGTVDWAIWGYAGNGTSTSLTPDVTKSGGTAIGSLTLSNPDSQAAALGGPCREVVFIDGAVSEAAALRAAARPGVEVVTLDPRGDELAQIGAGLARRHGLAAVHLVSHGEPGALRLGNRSVNASVLAQAGSLVAGWGTALAPDAEFLVYGCEAARGPAGSALVSALAKATGARVAAASHRVGAAELGGSWELDARTGAIASDIAFIRSRLAGFHHTLAVYDFTDSFDIENDGVPTVSGTYHDLTITVKDNDTSYPMPYAGTDAGTLYFGGEGWSHSEANHLLTIAKTNGAAFTPNSVTLFYYTYSPYGYNGTYESGTIGIKAYSGATVVGTDSIYYDGSGNANGGVFNVNFSSLSGFANITSIVFDDNSEDLSLSNLVMDAVANVAPVFVGSTTTLGVNQNAGATSITSLLHVSDPDSGQTETWSQSAAPSHGSLNFTGAIASSGGTDLAPGGTITYTPGSGFAGTDSFTIQVSDGIASATRTITVNVTPTAPSAPVLAAASDTGVSSSDDITRATSLNFSGTGAAANSTVTVFLDKNGNGTYDSGIDPAATSTANSSGAWSVANLSASGVSDGIYNVYAFATSATGSLTGPESTALSLTLDTTAPTVTLGSPSASITAGGPVTYTVTYSDANFNSSTLAAGNITLNKTGTANASVGVSGSGTTWTVTLAGITGDGTLAISMAAGTATDTAGNSAPAAGPSATFTVDNTAPTVAIGPPSAAITASGPVTYTVSYSDANFNSSTLAAGNITLNKTGTANASVAVSGSGATRTVTLSGMTGDGTLAISVAAGTATDMAGNSAPAAGPSATFTVDNTAPTVAIGSPSAAITAGGPVAYTVTYSDLNFNSSTLAAGNITLNTTGTANASVAVSGSGATRTVTLSGITGDGTLGISIAAGTATDTAGNPAPAAGPSAIFTVDNTAPTVAIGSPSATITAGGPVSYTVTYSDLNFNSSTLAAGNITLNATGTANASVGVSGSGATRTVTLSDIIGSGSLGISIAAGTATDLAGNSAPAAGPSSSFTVDNTPPQLQGGGALYVAQLENGTVTVYSNLPDTTVHHTVATGLEYVLSVAVDASGNVYAGYGGGIKKYNSAGVLVSGFGAGGTISSVGGDLIGMTLNPAGTRLLVSAWTEGSIDAFDTTTGSPAAGFTPVSLANAAGAVFNTSGTYLYVGDGAGQIYRYSVDGGAATPISPGGFGNLRALLFQDDTHLLVAATFNNTLKRYTLSGATATLDTTFGANNDGSVSLSTPWGLAADAAGNIYVSCFDGTTIAKLSSNGTVLNANFITGLSNPAQIAVVGGGLPITPPANGAYAAGQTLSFTANFNKIVTVTGTPQLGLTLGGGATDYADYVSGSGTSNLLFSYTVQAGDNGVLAMLSPVNLNGGTIADAVGNNAILTFSPPTTTGVLADTTAPTVAISSPSTDITAGGPVTYTVTYSDANFNASTLAAGNITLNPTGTATASVAVSGSGATRTVTLSGITGDGTLGISIAAGTATDLAGNSAPAAGPSATFTVDNTAPTVAIGSPSATITAGGPVAYTVTYSDLNFNSSTLAAGNITLNTTGTATASVAVSGSGATRTVTLSGITGDGTLGISIAAGTATDTAGNLAPAAGPSATFTVDNTAPTVAIGSPSATVTAGGPVAYTVTYSDANFNSSTLAAGNITLNPTGTANASVAVSGRGAIWTVTLSGITGDGTLGISIAAGTATDLAGNLAPAAGPSAPVTVENTPPSITSASSANGTYNTAFSYQISASATAVSYGANGLPSGLTVDPSGGAITGVPAQSGAFNATITATDAAGNTGSAPFLLTIGKAAAIVRLGNLNPTYDGAPKAASASTIPSGLDVNLTYNGSSSAPTAAGSYTVLGTITDPNYAGSATGTLAIAGAPLLVAANNQTRGYGQTNPVWTVSCTGFVNGENSNSLGGVLTFSFTDTNGASVANIDTNTPPGTYFIIPSGLTAANYSLTYSNGTLLVTPGVLTVAVNPVTKEYGATNPALSVTITGFLNGDNASVFSGSPQLSTSADVQSPVGVYDVVVALGTLSSTNYGFILTNGTLTVTPAPLIINPHDATRLYGAANPPVSGSVIGFQNDDGNVISASFVALADPTSSVGDYPIVMDGLFGPASTLANYRVSVNAGYATLQILPAPLTITANNAVRCCGAANPAFTGTIAGIQNGDNISATYSCSAGTATAPGAYPIVPAAVSPDNLQTNYQVTLVNGILTLLPATPTVTWTNPAPITYGAALSSVQLNATASVPGTAGYSPPAGTVLPVGAHTLSLVFSPTDATDYNSLTTSVTLVVLPAPLSIAAADARRPYGQTNPVLMGTITGLLNQDAITASYATAARTNSPAGTYAIAPSVVDPQGLASNYTVASANGTLTVTAALLLSATPGTVVVGQGPVPLDSTASVADGGSLNFGGGTLTVVVVTNASAGDSLGVEPPGTNSSELGLVGNTVTWGGANLASFQGGAGSNALTFSLTTNATSGPLTALLQQVALATVDTNGGTRIVQVTLAYGDITVAANRPLVLDRPPVANAADLWVTAAATVTIPISQVLAFDVSPDGTALSLESYSRASALGGQVGSDGTNFIYQPPSLTIQQDVLSYVVGDGKGGETDATVNLHLLPNGQLRLDVSQVSNTGAQLTVAGTPGQVYQIQASSDLIHWTTLETVTAAPTGAIEALDTLARTDPQRFYRALPQGP
jgi:hypothetical protein